MVLVPVQVVVALVATLAIMWKSLVLVVLVVLVIFVILVAPVVQGLVVVVVFLEAAVLFLALVVLVILVVVMVVAALEAFVVFCLRGDHCPCGHNGFCGRCGCRGPCCLCCPWGHRGPWIKGVLLAIVVQMALVALGAVLVLLVIWGRRRGKSKSS